MVQTMRDACSAGLTEFISDGQTDGRIGGAWAKPVENSVTASRYCNASIRGPNFNINSLHTCGTSSVGEHWRIQKFWRGREGDGMQCTRLSAPSSFIANAHNEQSAARFVFAICHALLAEHMIFKDNKFIFKLKSLYGEKATFWKKGLRPIGDRRPPPPPHWIRHLMKKINESLACVLWCKMSGSVKTALVFFNSAVYRPANRYHN